MPPTKWFDYGNEDAIGLAVVHMGEQSVPFSEKNFDDNAEVML